MSEQNVVDVPSRSAADDFEPDFDGGEFEGGSEGSEGGAGQPAPGQGQSKSSRRRRRKRKKLTTVAAGSAEASAGEAGGAATFAPIVMEGESLALVQNESRGSNGSAPQPAQTHEAGQSRSQGQGQPQGGGQGSSQGGAQGQGQGQGKRWKKKFRDRERRVREPGNDAPREERSHSNHNGSSNAGGGHYERPHRGGGRPDNFGNLVSTVARKQKPQTRERGFVGPMDHSYREGNPEFGDVPPSTISTRGRRTGHHGDSQPIDRNAPRPKPIAEDAQTHIYMFVEDLFVAAKVNETARKMGIKVAFVKNEKEPVAELTSGEALNKPALIVFDLNNAAAKPLTLIPKLKAKLKRSCSIIGFLSHLQGDLKAKAVEAGCDVVMPRSAFSQGLPNLLRRYGAEEEDEVNFNY